MDASLAKGVALGNLESIVDLTAAATAAAVLLALTQRATLGEGRRHLSTQGYTGVMEIWLQPLVPRSAASGTRCRRHLLQLFLEDDTLAQHGLVHRLLHAPLRNAHTHRGLAPEGSVQAASLAAPRTRCKGCTAGGPRGRRSMLKPREPLYASTRACTRAPRALSASGCGWPALLLPRRFVPDHAGGAWPARAAHRPQPWFAVRGPPAHAPPDATAAGRA